MIALNSDLYQYVGVRTVTMTFLVLCTAQEMVNVNGKMV